MVVHIECDARTDRNERARQSVIAFLKFKSAPALSCFLLVKTVFFSCVDFIVLITSTQRQCYFPSVSIVAVVRLCLECSLLILRLLFPSYGQKKGTTRRFNRYNNLADEQTAWRNGVFATTSFRSTRYLFASSFGLLYSINSRFGSQRGSQAYYFVHF